jgi:hypothetical protein
MSELLPECDVCEDDAVYRLKDSDETCCVFHITEAGEITEGVEILTDSGPTGPPSQPGAAAGAGSGFAEAADADAPATDEAAGGEQSADDASSRE